MAPYPKLRASIEAAGRVQTECIAARNAAIAELGESICSVHIPIVAFRGLLLEDLIQLWVNEQDRVHAAPAPAPAVAAVVQSRIAPIPTRPVGATDRRVVEKPVAPVVAPVTPTKPKRQPRRDKIAVNSKLVVLLRSGIELPGGEQSVAGDVIGTLTMEQADALLRAGAAELASNA